MSTPLWLGTEASFHKLVAIEENIMRADETLRLRADAWESEDDGEECHWMLQMEGNVGIVTIKGPMSAGYAGWWGMYFGYCGYDDIKEAVNDALEKGATDLLYVWDTGGGSVDGIEEMSQFLRDVMKLDQVKSTTSFTSSTCASAGLWLATEADKFYATPMSQVGSIGVLAVHREYTQQMEMYGIKATVFRSAPHKALGNPYEKLSQEAEDKINEDILTAHGFFVDRISENCGLPREYVAETLATGDMWYAAEANQLRVIDGVKLLNDVFVALLNKSNENTGNYQARTTEVDMKHKKITPQAQALIASGVPVDKALEDVTEEDSTEEEDVDTTKDVPEEEEVDTSIDKDKTEANASGVSAQLASMTDQLVDAKVKLATAEATIATMRASFDGMKQVVATTIQKAYVGIGSPAPDMDGLLAMDPSVLLQQHAQVSEMLNKRFGIGGRVSVQAEDETDDEAMKKLQEAEEQARLKLATIKPQS